LREREREREKERERETHTDREKERKGERERQRETEKETEKERETTFLFIESNADDDFERCIGYQLFETFIFHFFSKDENPLDSLYLHHPMTTTAS
jgi:hypothetical protein